MPIGLLKVDIVTMKMEVFKISRVSLLTGNLNHKEIDMSIADYEKLTKLDFIPENLSVQDKHFLNTGIIEAEYKAFFGVPEFKR